MMRHLLLILALPFVGCGLLTEPRTTLKYDPNTGIIDAARHWNAGPVELKLKVNKPDGTVVEAEWKSDINLDPASTARAGDQAVLQTAIETIQTLAVPVP